MASINAERAPWASNWRSPAAVVPAGDVTAARKASALSPVSLSSRAEPSSLWMTSSEATGRGKPDSTPASIIASATRNTYAGPDPDNPVTASSNRSGTSTTVPTDLMMPVAHSISGGPADTPAETAVALVLTSAAMLGIARTTAQPPGHQDSRSLRGTPAAIERSLPTPASPSRRQTPWASPGLTARMALCAAGSRPSSSRSPG